MEMSQAVNKSATMRYVNVPARYLEEWGIKDRPIVQRMFTEGQINFWKLIPTSKETPYEDEPNLDTYFVEYTYNALPNADKQWDALSNHDLIKGTKRI
jgi:hypothetical protein